LGNLCDLALYFVSNLSHFFQLFAFWIFQMPLDQLLLHLSNDRFWASFFDRAPHRYHKTCAFDHFRRERLRIVVRDVYSAFQDRLDYDWVDFRGRNGPGALGVQSLLSGEGLGHLASSRVLKTDKQYGTLAQSWLSRIV